MNLFWTVFKMKVFYHEKIQLKHLTEYQYKVLIRLYDKKRKPFMNVNVEDEILAILENHFSTFFNSENSCSVLMNQEKKEYAIESHNMMSLQTWGFIEKHKDDFPFSFKLGKSKFCEAFKALGFALSNFLLVSEKIDGGVHGENECFIINQNDNISLNEYYQKLMSS